MLTDSKQLTEKANCSTAYGFLNTKKEAALSLQSRKTLLMVSNMLTKYYGPNTLSFDISNIYEY